MPLFFGDLLAATPTWDGEERAVYVLLLAYQWTAGPLPNDVKRLAKMCQYDVKRFAALWQTVGPKFDLHECGLLNERLEQHREKSLKLSEKNSNSGKKGAAKRWGKDGERHSERHGETDGERHGTATGVTHSNPSHPIPSHSSTPPGFRTTRAELSADFEQFLDATYPATAHSRNVPDGVHRAQGLVGGGLLTEGELRARLVAFRAFVDTEGYSGPDKVPSMRNWLDRNHPERYWARDWAPIPTKAQRVQDSNIAASQAWLRSSANA